MDNQNQEQPAAPAANAWIGIDVAKAKLDVHIIGPDDRSFSGKFENTDAGNANLIKWAKRITGKSTRHFGMEATGTYSLGPAIVLAEAGERVSIVNPYRAKSFAQSEGVDNKNDKIDARGLAKFCKEKCPALWKLPPAEILELTNMSRHLGNLITMKTQQSNRLGEPRLSEAVKSSLEKMIGQIDEEIATIEKAIIDLINTHPDLRDKRDLLVSICGIADRTAARILAEIPDITAFESVSSLIRHAGLNPVEHESGTSVHKKTKIARKGNRRLRTSLYMPALSAIQYNPLVRDLYQRLRSAGKQKMVALVAAMRKLLAIIYGVLRHGKPFDATHATSAASH